MKKYLLLILAVVFTFNVQAQNESCDGNRYIDDVFTEIKVTKGIKYGEGITLFENFQELYMDVYEPEGDDFELRPVIILAFGGSYIGGERGDLEFLCEAYARKGYVAVTIDYRLFDGPLIPFPTADQMKVVVIKSVSDMKAAIRHMREDADTDNLFRIDPNNVFVGGVSAGSITAFHTAALDETDVFPADIQTILEENGGIEGNTSDNFEYSSEVQGLINFSGGLNDASWIDENDPPFVSIHDEIDGIVPYEGGFAMVFGIPIIYMEGSKTCKDMADDLGIKNQLKTIENSLGHVSYLSNATKVAENTRYTAEFIAEIICGEPTASTNEVAGQLASIEIFPNPSFGNVNIKSNADLDLNIELVDLYGRSLTQFSNVGSLDLNDFNNGIYFLKIIDSKSKSTRTIKVVLEK